MSRRYKPVYMVENTSDAYETELEAQIRDQNEALQSIEEAIAVEPSEELIEVGSITVL